MKCNLRPNQSDSGRKLCFKTSLHVLCKQWCWQYRCACIIVRSAYMFSVVCNVAETCWLSKAVKFNIVDECFVLVTISIQKLPSSLSGHSASDSTSIRHCQAAQPHILHHDTLSGRPASDCTTMRQVCSKLAQRCHTQRRCNGTAPCTPTVTVVRIPGNDVTCRSYVCFQIRHKKEHTCFTDKLAFVSKASWSCCLHALVYEFTAHAVLPVLVDRKVNNVWHNSAV